MKKFLIYFIALIILSSYFILTVLILPSEFLTTEQFIPQPIFEATLSESTITLGESFRLEIISKNTGDYADIHIVSIGFPDLGNFDDVVKIVTYDFTLSPSYISVGDEIGSNYSGGIDTVFAKYPSIEAMSRPLKPNVETHFDAIITPKNSGIFNVYVKSIDIPHTSENSHYPKNGFLDQQNEYVLIYSVTVNP